MEKEYKSLRREEKQIYKNRKKASVDAELQKWGNLNKQSETRKLYQKINKSRKEFKLRTSVGKDQNGNILTEQEVVLQRWTKEIGNEAIERNGYNR